MYICIHFVLQLVYSFDNNNIESPSVTPTVSPISNHIGGVMVSVLASSAVDRGFDPRRVKSKTITLFVVDSPLST